MILVSDMADTKPIHDLHVDEITDAECGSGILHEAELATEAGIRLLRNLQYIKDLFALALPVLHTNKEYLYFSIETRLRNHLRWKLLSTARCIKEGIELEPEQVARVNKEYLQSLTEDIALEVLITNYTAASDSLNSAQL